MDIIDRKLIQLLQENARYPIKYLSEVVGLSSPAVSVRLVRLEKRGIIGGYNTRIVPAGLGYHLKAYISVKLFMDQEQPMIEFLEKHPSVVECDFVTGDASVIIRAYFTDTHALFLFINDLKHYGIITSQVSLSTPIELRPLRVPDSVIDGATE